MSLTAQTIGLSNLQRPQRQLPVNTKACAALILHSEDWKPFSGA